MQPLRSLPPRPPPRRPPQRIMPPVSLSSLLSKFTETEVLGTPMPCSTCGRDTNATKRIRFKSLGPVLLLVVKRFEGWSGRKVTRSVDFPVSGLDMSGWCDSDQDDKGEGGGREGGTLYDLYATLNHVGGINQGHYTANVKGVVGGGEGGERR